jgi:acetyl esterase/lipase
MCKLYMCSFPVRCCCDVIVCIFVPEGDISDMSLDVQTAITFVFRHIESFGGDPNCIFLAGQSAGAHLGSLAVLQNCEALLAGKRTSWTAHKLRGFIGISGPYDLPHIQEHLDRRGLPSMVFRRMMKSRSEDDLSRYSPARLAQQPWLIKHMRGGDTHHSTRTTGHGHPTHHHTRMDRLLPPFLLIHGKADKTVHFKETDFFARCLHAAGVPVSVRYYKNYSHTDPIIEGPLTGHDHLCHDILAFIRTQCEKHTQQQQMISHGNRSVSLLSLNADMPADSRSILSMNEAHSRSGSSISASPDLPPSFSTSPPLFSDKIIPTAIGATHQPSPRRPAAALDASHTHVIPVTEPVVTIANTSSMRADSALSPTSLSTGEGESALSQRRGNGVHHAQEGDQLLTPLASSPTIRHPSSIDVSASPDPIPRNESGQLHPFKLPFHHLIPSFLLPSPTAKWNGGKKRQKSKIYPSSALSELIDDVNDSDDDICGSEGEEEMSEDAHISPRSSNDSWYAMEDRRHEERVVNAKLPSVPNGTAPDSDSIPSTVPNRFVYPLQAPSQLPRRPPRSLIPRTLIRIARYINPF